ncbi:MAG: GGDEF domain-containing protein [Hyphomicrobiales bacterium]|jgi:GGDEF domain-containing protein
MALLGPMLVVAESSATDFIDVLGKAGAFPIAQTRWADVPAAIAETQPVALAIAEPQPKPSPRHVDAAIECIETRGGPIMPVIARVDTSSTAAIPGALPIAMNESNERLTAQLCWALRIRTLHATVLRRSRAAAATKKVPTFVPPDLLEDAAVLCVARGGSYLALSAAISQRTGLIGALSVDTAARYLNARDVEGVVIGDGLGPRVAETLLIMLAENARFRDLPVGVLNNVTADDERLPNLVRVDAVRLVERILPFVRLQTFAGQLTRTLKSLESEQAIDPHTGLLAAQTFWRKLERAVQESEETSAALAVARFTFDGVADHRAYVDAARLFSRLVRNIDFAYREQDGSILAAFTKTDLRSAHLLARRIASVLRHTMLSPDRDRRAIKPTITLAALKPTDDLSTLVARLGAHPKVAAE